MSKLSSAINRYFPSKKHEEKCEKELINSQIMKLIDDIEEDAECRHQPERFKPGTMSMDEFIESGKTYRKELKNYITRLLNGDFELYQELVQSEREN